MVAAVGSSTTSPVTYPKAPSTAGIEAEIQTYQKELADCVTCPSAGTPEGKKAIAEASEKIASARARIEKIESSQPRPAPTQLEASAAADLPSSKPSTAAAGDDTSATYSASGLPEATMLRLIDVYA